MIVRSLIRTISSVFIIGLLSSMLVTVCGYYYLVHTTQGARWFFDFLAQRYLGAQTFKYRSLEGTLANGITLSNVRITDLDRFTTRNLVLIQHLEVAAPGFNIHNMSIKIRNGRVKFPLSDPIGFYGTFEKGGLNFNAYCGIIDVREIVTVIKNQLTLHNLQGTAKKASMTLRGPYDRPEIRGEFLLEDFRYLGFALSELPASFQYAVSRGERHLLWNGELSVPSGRLISRLTKIDLGPSRLIFTGIFKNPALEINGSSKVNQTVINISLKGTKDKPQLNVTSNPPKSKSLLMVMLATGQELVLPQDDAAVDRLFPASDRDFVDYFTFSTDGQSPNAVGLTDFSLNMQDNLKWLGIKHRLTDQVKVGIILQETRSVDGLEGEVTRKVGGEVQVADSITVGVDKDVSEPSPVSTGQPDAQPKDDGMDVMIKYKKSF